MEVMGGLEARDYSQATKQEAEREKDGIPGADSVVLVEAMHPLRPRPNGI